MSVFLSWFEILIVILLSLSLQGSNYVYFLWFIHSWFIVFLLQVKEVAPAARRKSARLSFAFVYPDNNGRFKVKEVSISPSLPHVLINSHHPVSVHWYVIIYMRVTYEILLTCACFDELCVDEWYWSSILLEYIWPDISFSINNFHFFFLLTWTFTSIGNTI